MTKGILLAIMFFSFIGCQTPGELPATSPRSDDVPDQISYNASMTLSENGVVSSKISYGRMEQYSNRKILKFFDGVNIVTYDAGERSVELEAGEATLNEISGDFELTVDVEAQSHDGMTLSSQKLVWNEKNHNVRSDVFVTVVTAEKDTINGTGFESEPSFANWMILKPSGVSQKKLSFDENIR